MWPKTQPRSSECQTFESRLAGVWSKGRAARVQKTFDATGKSYAPDSYARVDHVLQARLSEWEHGYQDECRAPASPDGEDSVLHTMRLGCFDQYLDDVDASVRVLEEADATVVERAADLMTNLGNVRYCSNAKALRMREALPRDAAARARIAATRRKVALAGAYAEAWLPEKGLPLVEQAVAEARELGYQPLLASALLGRCQISPFTATGNVERARRDCREAAQAAELGGDLRARISALLQLSFLSIKNRVLNFQNDPPDDEWRAISDEASALAAQLGDEDLQIAASFARRTPAEQGSRKEREMLEALLERVERNGEESRWAAGTLWNLAASEAANGAFADAVRTSERAQHAYEAAFGPRHPTMAYARSQYAYVLILAGRSDEALRYQDEALDILGPDKGLRSPLLYQFGAGLAAQGEDARALVYLEQAVAFLEEAAPQADNPALIDMLIDTGGASLRTGNPQRALELLERAKQIAEHDKVENYPYLGIQMGDTLVTLGRLDDARPWVEHALAALAEKKEPVVEERRALADGHFVLARALIRTAPEAAHQHAETAARLYAELAPLGLGSVTKAMHALEAWSTSEHPWP
jgi:hypothetical protein